MNTDEIRRKIFKYAAFAVILCFAATTAHLIFINYRHGIGDLAFSLIINAALHIIALFASMALSTASAKAVYELWENYDDEKNLEEKNKHNKFSEKIISGDFTSLKGESTEPSHEKLAAFISGFLSDAGDIGTKKIDPSKYSGPYKETLEKLGAIQRELEISGKYLGEISSAINMANPNSITADNPLPPQLKQLLNNMNALEALLGNLAQMNVDINPGKIEGNERLSRFAFSVGEKYSDAFGVIRNNLNSLKYSSSAMGRDIQGLSKLTRDQADILGQIKNISANMEKQLKTIQTVVFEGSRPILRTRSSLSAATFDAETRKYIEKISATSTEMAAVIKNLSQLDSQLNKLTAGNSGGENNMARLSANIEEAAKNTRFASDAIDKFNFRNSSAAQTFERYTSAERPYALEPRLSRSEAALRRPSDLSSADTSAGNPKERRIRSGSPPIAPRPVLKPSESNYNFESTDYGKYSKK